MIEQMDSAAALAAWARAHAAVGARLQLDSRRLRAGDVFVALRGRTSDGMRYLQAAEKAGAAAVLCEKRDDLQGLETSLPVCMLEGLADQIGWVADAFYDCPTAHLRAVAVTGTNGKTSTSHWIAALLNSLHHPCAVVGTIGAFLGEKSFEVPALTTPDAVSNQTIFSEIYAAGAQCFAVEASSIGLQQGRLTGTRFDVAVFTNLTRDHLDYHGSLQAYEQAKAILFDWPGLKHAVINADDPAGRRMIERTLARGVHTIATTQSAQTTIAGADMMRAEHVRATPHGVHFEVCFGTERFAVQTALLGRFNVDNLMGAAGALLALGLPAQAVFARLLQLQPPAGRLQNVSRADEPMVVVDYAHTPDALQKAIAALREVAHVRRGRICAVFGAGGDRDPGKRILMGQEAARGADAVIVTSDNPRTEDPQRIAQAVADGVQSVTRQPARVILDRQEAIEAAVAAAHTNDIVLIAGKGHEDYQDIKGVKYPFSDAEVARQALEARRQTSARLE